MLRSFENHRGALAEVVEFVVRALLVRRLDDFRDLDLQDFEQMAF